MMNSSSHKIKQQTNNEPTAKKKMSSLCVCVIPQADDDHRFAQRSKDIDKKLKKDAKVYKATHRLLLLGKIQSLLFVELNFLNNID
jgi:hypothetical protein